MKKIVVAYSGGLDTSVILNWLKDTYGAEIIAFCADVGQAEELDGLEEKALKTGAAKCYVDDLQEEFARDFIFPMLQAGAIYEGQYFLGTSIARPLIAKRMVEIARAEGATAVAHGATGKGNDQVRFELTAAALAPEIEIIAPWRDSRFREKFPGRSEMIAYAEAQAPGNDTEREAQKGLKRLLTDCQSQQACGLRADGDRSEEPQPRESKAGPDFPNPFFGIALKRDSEFSRHPASGRHAKEKHHGGSCRVSQPCCEGRQPHGKPCGNSTRNGSHKIKKTQRKRRRDSSHKRHHIFKPRPSEAWIQEGR